ncbi:CAP domain-containing protein [Marinilabiliaceae bacterium ANBcel2]|nr:CAP domain-containing protein [Marinilabiliaceae bacterium ANBcel2]
MKLYCLLLFIFIPLYLVGEGQVDGDLVLKYVNSARTEGASCGGSSMASVAPLKWDDKLSVAAFIHAEDMMANDFFSHEGSDGSSVGDRVEKVEFDWRAVGENVAYNYDDEKLAVEGWLDSPGHCTNIMNPEFTHMGVAVSSDGKYWVQVFASPFGEED